MKIVRLAVPVLLFPGLFLSSCDAPKDTQNLSPVIASPAVAASSPGSPVPAAALPTPEPLPAKSLDASDMAFVNAVLPLVNNDFPYRNLLKPDQSNPALRRAPTNKLVVKQISGNGFESPEHERENEKRARDFISNSLKTLNDKKMVDAYFAANRERYALPAAVYQNGVALDYAAVNLELAKKDPDTMKYGFNWWVALEKNFPAASAIVTVSKPVVSAAGDKAFMSATVETNQPDRFTTYYAFDKYQGQWVVSNSATLR